MIRTLSLLILLGGCEAEQDPCVHEPALTYENFGRGFTNQFCAGCHSSLVPTVHRNEAPPGYDFNTYEGILLWADRIRMRAVFDGDMPPGGGPTEAELALFDEWLLCEVMPDAEVYWGVD